MDTLRRGVVFLGAALAALASDARAAGALTVGINKAAGGAQTEKAAAAIPKLLGDALKREVKVSVSADYDALAADLLAGKVDLAWMSPLAYVAARAKNKELVPVAKAVRNGSLYYRSVIVVPKSDTTTASIKDLKGKKMAWVSKSSTSGYLFPRALLKRQGIEADGFFSEQVITGSHDESCKQAAEGKVAAAATYADEPAEGAPFRPDGCGPLADSLRILSKTGPISNDVLVARPGLPADDVKAVAAALASLKGDGVKEAFRADGFGIAQESDFDPVEQASKLIAAEVMAETK